MTIDDSYFGRARNEMRRFLPVENVQIYLGRFVKPPPKVQEAGLAETQLSIRWELPQPFLAGVPCISILPKVL